MSPSDLQPLPSGQNDPLNFADLRRLEESRASSQAADTLAAAATTRSTELEIAREIAGSADAIHEISDDAPAATPDRAPAIATTTAPDLTTDTATAPAETPTAAATTPVLSANSVPRLSETQEKWIRAIALTSFAYGLYWITWRWTHTFNPSAPIFSTILLLAETYGWLTFGGLIYTVWRLQHREPPPAREGLTVDVFVTCFNEPLQLLRRTAIGAKAIRYPHRTWMLDDGRRPEVRAMAESLGIGYITRENNEHAKAGNLNNALKHTDGEFVLQLDADHVPLPNILDRLLGYFNDEKVAFVQSPQDFYNTDSFTHVVNDEGRRLWEENRLFFSLVQPGKDARNSAFFCGSCGVLRRSALEEIGGFSTQTITEDMETSLRIHARGWQSVYHGETLAYGLAPASAEQYHVQRLRWGQGSMQILRKLNPLTYPGLTLAQRIQYLTSVTVYFDGLQKLVFYLTPVVFFLTGWSPVSAVNNDLMIRAFIQLGLTILSFELLARGTGYLLIAERYNMTKFFTYVMSVGAYFTTKPLRFRTTPKGESSVPFRTYAPQLALAFLLAGSVLWATIAWGFRLIDYGVDGWHSMAFKFNAAWCIWNLYFAVYVVRHSIKSRQQRHDHRFVESMPTSVRVIQSGMLTPAPAQVAMTQDLNTTGLSFRSPHKFEIGTELEIPLPLTSGIALSRGEVKRVEKTKTRYGTVYTHGVRFYQLPMKVRDAIELHCTQHSVPLWRLRYRQSMDVVAQAMERFSDHRESRRRSIQLPAMVKITSPDGETAGGMALLEEVSREGARLILEAPVTPGSTISWDVPGTSLRGSGTAVFNRAFESPMNVRFVVGVQRERERFDWLAPIRRMIPARSLAVS